MIKAAASLLVLFAAATAHAGSFGGPPPFTNGSPLPSGDDGVYQASMRGKNLSGIFSFAYSGGLTSTPHAYYVFVNGQVYEGLVQASISTNSISGVLDIGFSAASPLVTGSGYFNGSIDKNSSTAAFDGDGKFTLVDGSDSANSSSTITTTHTYTSSDGSTVTETTSQSTDSSSGGPTFAGSYNFKFQGVRAYIQAAD